MGELDGNSRAPLGVSLELHPGSFPTSCPSFPALSVNHRARQINSLRFSAFQLPLPPLPDHVVYPEEESGVFGTLEWIHSSSFEEESGKWRRNACLRISFPYNEKSGKFRLLYKWLFSANNRLISLIVLIYFQYLKKILIEDDSAVSLLSLKETNYKANPKRRSFIKQEAAVKEEAMKEGSSLGSDSRLTLTR